MLTDPEIPVVTLRELGILREVRFGASGLEVVITPTYSGCPAMGQIEDDVQAALAAHGLDRPRGNAACAGLDHRLDERGRAQQAQGLRHRAAAGVLVAPRAVRRAAGGLPAVRLANTTETSHFGSTACKALYRCLDCMEPFDYFKPY